MSVGTMKAKSKRQVPRREDYSISEAATYLRVTPRTVQNAIQVGLLHSIDSTTNPRLRAQEVEALRGLNHDR